MQIYPMCTACNDIWITTSKHSLWEMASNKKKQVLMIAYNGPSVGLNVLY